MAAVKWSNGKIDRADSWEELLRVVGKTQWHPEDEQGIRATLAKRAWRWSQTDMDESAPAATFFRSLQRAGLVLIISDNEKEEI